MEWKNQIKHSELLEWIEEMVTLCKPTEVYLCDGSEEEWNTLCALLADNGTFIKLNDSRPNSYWCRTDPEDVARVEEATFICTKTEEEAGPTNNWKDPDEMHALLQKRFEGCMQGRRMYIIPYCMGPLGSKSSHIGVEITDSAYVAVNMKLMTRMGKSALEALGSKSFVKCMHSVGVPLEDGEKDVAWPCNPKERCIVHFPQDHAIWSFGSGYGGNALLGKKCFALRIASYLAKEQMWMAEHMLILGLTNPEGKKKYFAAAFPSACGKTNLAMLESTLPGWKVECVGDDIAWMRIGEDGRLWAINPEAGFFGVAPGTSQELNPSAMKTLEKNAIFTNVALTKDRDVWWEGMSKEPPVGLTDWQGKAWTKESGGSAAHPNARFTVAAKQCPIMDPAWEDPEGVPIEAILFGGRRATTIPLVVEAMNWQHGTFMGACISSEMTAAAKGQVGKLRHDPFAMLPFCGYNMGEYFGHWLEMGHQTDKNHLPKIFAVNWFLKDDAGSFLWPGFGENVRVLKWIFERLENQAKARETPIGWVPEIQALDTEGLDLSAAAKEALLRVDNELWIKEAEEIQSYFTIFGSHLPKPLHDEQESLTLRLEKG